MNKDVVFSLFLPRESKKIDIEEILRSRKNISKDKNYSLINYYERLSDEILLKIINFREISINEPNIPYYDTLISEDIANPTWIRTLVENGPYYVINYVFLSALYIALMGYDLRRYEKDLKDKYQWLLPLLLSDKKIETIVKDDFIENVDDMYKYASENKISKNVSYEILDYLLISRENYIKEVERIERENMYISLYLFYALLRFRPMKIIKIFLKIRDKNNVINGDYFNKDLYLINKILFER